MSSATVCNCPQNTPDPTSSLPRPHFWRFYHTLNLYRSTRKVRNLETVMRLGGWVVGELLLVLGGWCCGTWLSAGGSGGAGRRLNWHCTTTQWFVVIFHWHRSVGWWCWATLNSLLPRMLNVVHRHRRHYSVQTQHCDVIYWLILTHGTPVESNLSLKANFWTREWSQIATTVVVVLGVVVTLFTKCPRLS